MDIHDMVAYQEAMEKATTLDFDEFSQWWWTDARAWLRWTVRAQLKEITGLGRVEVAGSRAYQLLRELAWK